MLSTLKTHINFSFDFSTMNPISFVNMAKNKKLFYEHYFSVFGIYHILFGICITIYSLTISMPNTTITPLLSLMFIISGIGILYKKNICNLFLLALYFPYILKINIILSFSIIGIMFCILGMFNLYRYKWVIYYEKKAYEKIDNPDILTSFFLSSTNNYYK